MPATLQGALERIDVVPVRATVVDDDARRRHLQVVRETPTTYVRHRVDTRL